MQERETSRRKSIYILRFTMPFIEQQQQQKQPVLSAVIMLWE
jgi:hypothetical protein